MEYSLAGTTRMQLAGVLALCLAGCSRVDEQTADPTQSHAKLNQTDTLKEPARLANPPASTDTVVSDLDDLRRRGLLAEYAKRTLIKAKRLPSSAKVQLLKADVLLASGRPDEAEQTAWRWLQAGVQSADELGQAQAIRLWTTARLRQGKPLAGDGLAAILARLSESSRGVEVLRFWHTSLAGRAPYEVGHDGPARQLELKRATAWAGLTSYNLDGIEVEMNGVKMPLVFIDTGGQHTLITRDTAERAGVRIGASARELVGFTQVTAQPAVLRELRIGSLVVRDIPVLVGDSTSLTLAKGQAALGIDLLHHARFTIDYPGRAVWAESSARLPLAPETTEESTWPATNPTAQPDVSQPAWEIPLWTFSQACLTEARMPNGEAARVLIDTGNRLGAFASARWAKRVLPRFQPPPASLFSKAKHRKFDLPEVELGGRPLPRWPVLDVLPADLERLDAVDILLGYDLLWQYQVTIDLRERVLTLRSADKPPQPEARE